MNITILEEYFIWLMFYSVAGWVYESLICSVEARRFINRGFLNGPYCPIYGFGAILDIVLLGQIRNPAYLFLLGVIVTCTLEYLTSYGMEKIFHARWWDYSDKKFNLNGRVCLIGAVVFGAFSVVLIRFIHPFVLSCTGHLPSIALHCISVVLFAVLLVDNAITIGGFSGFNKKLKEFSDTLEQVKSGTTERIRNSQAFTAMNTVYDSFSEKLNRQQKRMIFVFPRLKSMRYNGILTKLKKTIFGRKDDDEK